MKKDTFDKRTKIANDIMFYIYTHIDTDIDIEELSFDLRISKFHMHRIFKEVFGRNIYESIKLIRLQKASNLLITNNLSTISNIANLCGYSSQTSFIKVFKNRFNMTPKEWRNGGYKVYSSQILEQSKKSMESNANFSHLEPTIVKMPIMHSYYVRNQGYDISIKKTWQKLYTWVLGNEFKNYKQIALYHDNPTITPLESCQYIACIVTDEPILLNSRLPKFIISDGVYAKFDLQGVYGDVLKFIHWVYHEWLPSSGFETTTKPSYSIYKKNHFLSDDNSFELSFYVPIRY
ncbi:AraC family transcriptional regulator [Arcobacter sp. FWKO B]|uniref:AraC family transcriptional regulator n=1 Tax=Arcobacter sp. FWKO B TaxID=2593672 RepID=UPI0018A530B1|nr:AraC family transcriptional regulator [Arcobacter sp. FWKO B]QOG13018.1 AraC family transcriptional regulator [Arcobacter sp. FWKO B]